MGVESEAEGMGLSAGRPLNDEEPRYLQAIKALRSQIESGALKPGDRLPGERDLARSFNISQMTMNRALTELARGGVLVRHVGRGTFVAEDAPVTTEPHRITLVVAREVSPSEDSYLGYLIRGIQQVALQKGVEFSFASATDEGYEALLSRRATDGLLLLYPDDHLLPELLGLQKCGVPFVVLGASWPGEDLPCVDSTNYEGTLQAIRYLHRLGHRRIGCVLGALQTSNTRDRRDGFRVGLEEVGVEWNAQREAEWLIEGPSHARGLDEHQMERLQALLMAPDGPTAFFCGGYNLALATMEGVRSTRLRIPDQISVVGFDDPLSAAHLHPPLTTIRQPLVEMGSRAMHRLLGFIAAGTPASGTEMLDTELVIRASCAPPGG